MKNSLYLLFSIIILSSVSSAQQGERVRIMTYNLLNYPDQYEGRNPDFRVIINQIEPDIVLAQEVNTNFGVTKFLSDVLDSAKFNSGIPRNNFNNDNAIFYKDSLFDIITDSYINSSPRDIGLYRLVHKFTGDTIILFSAHFKANNDPADQQQRLIEATNFRNYTINLSPNTNFILAGDFNVYTSNEPAYQKLLNQSTSGYLLDPIDKPGNWTSNSTFAAIHTQSTRTDSSGGGAGGGLDDRFDFILISQAVKDSGGIFYKPGSYWSFGNDGLHFNQSIKSPPFTFISEGVAQCLHGGSDHLPVYADFYFGNTTSIVESKIIVNNFNLEQNFPNPFNPSTVIKYQIPTLATVSLKIYDVIGNEIAILVNEEKDAGSYEVEFNAQNLSSGIYFYQLVINEFVNTKKMVLIK